MNSLQEKSPPGWRGSVKAMKKHKNIDNPFALAWHMKKKGDTAHYKDKKKGKPEKKKRFKEHKSFAEFLEEKGFE